MQVLVYAPAAMWGRDRHLAAMAQEVRRLGHCYAGAADNPAAARAARDSGLVDLVACRPADLPDLVDWVLPLEIPHPRPRVPVMLGGAAVVVIEKAGVWIAGLVHTM